MPLYFVHTIMQKVKNDQKTQIKPEGGPASSLSVNCSFFPFFADRCFQKHSTWRRGDAAGRPRWGALRRSLGCSVWWELDATRRKCGVSTAGTWCGNQRRCTCHQNIRLSSSIRTCMFHCCMRPNVRTHDEMSGQVWSIPDKTCLANSEFAWSSLLRKKKCKRVDPSEGDTGNRISVLWSSWSRPLQSKQPLNNSGHTNKTNVQQLPTCTKLDKSTCGADLRENYTDQQHSLSTYPTLATSSTPTLNTF